MKKFGLIVLLMGVSFFCVGNAWAAKQGAKQGTVTVKCTRLGLHYKVAGKLRNVPTPVSTPDLNCEPPRGKPRGI